MIRRANRSRHRIIDFLDALNERVIRSLSPKWSRGWRLTVVAAFIASVSILLLNSTLLVWYYTSAPVADGVKVLFVGKCATVRRLDTWIHLLINLFSTVLLIGSNFCMPLKGC